MVGASKMQRREMWVDIAKGLGIIAVVLGHTESSAARYIYWFHMPLFFALSGYLFRPLEDPSALRPWIRKRTQQLLIPYVSFVLLLLIARYIQHPPTSLAKLGRDVLGIAAGGRLIPREFVGLYAPIWFITCLYCTQIAFMVITLKWKSFGARMGIIIAAYALAHVESGLNAAHRIPFIWDADVALLALSYYGFGFFAKPLLAGRRHPGATAVAALGISAAFVLAGMFKLMNYSLDMKYLGYNHPVLNMVVPMVMIVSVCVISRALETTGATPLLAALGMASLPIMYMHMYVNEFISQYYEHGILLFTLFGLFIPMGIWYLFRQFTPTRRLFLGSR